LVGDDYDVVFYDVVDYGIVSGFEVDAVLFCFGVLEVDKVIDILCLLRLKPMIVLLFIIRFISFLQFSHIYLIDYFPLHLLNTWCICFTSLYRPSDPVFDP